MPIFKYKNVTLHFAHVPKCGGTSIERYAQSLNGVTIGMLDEYYEINAPQQRWNVTSPQHIDGESLARLFPKDFFSAFFAVVRHPVKRLESAYKFQRLVERRIENVSLDDFVKSHLTENYLTVGWMDNHFYPQSGFFYPGADYHIYKLEDGGPQKAKELIDKAFFGNPTSIEMSHSNRMQMPDGLDPNEFVLSQEALEIIQDLYAMDFENFGYTQNAPGTSLSAAG